MFSLAVVDKLTTGDLNGSKFVAGTGTITGDGKVGSIGGITHKMVAAHEAGATVFLVPADNCDEAKIRARGRHGAGQGGHPGPGGRRVATRFPLVANLPAADRLARERGCVELWHVDTMTCTIPRLELTSGYAARGENAEADAT